MLLYQREQSVSYVLCFPEIPPKFQQKRLLMNCQLFWTILIKVKSHVWEKASIGCLLHTPSWGPGRNPGMCPDWDGTGDPSIHRPALSPLSHTSQGISPFVVTVCSNSQRWWSGTRVGHKFFDIPSIYKWGLCPLPLNLGGLCVCLINVIQCMWFCAKFLVPGP